MGLEAAGMMGSDGHASARGWSRGANQICNETSVAVAASRLAWRRLTWLRRVTWLRALTAGALALLVLEFIAPVATRAPGLRATSESLITLLALLGAVVLAAQFGHTRRLRDLILLGALVLFVLVEGCCGALPAALDIRSGDQFGASMQLGQLFVAAAIAAAALAPPDRMVVGHWRPVAIVFAVGLGVLAAVEVCALLAAGELVLVANHSLFGIRAATVQPLALAVVVVTSGLLGYAAARFVHRARVERDGVMSMLAGALVLMTVARLYFLALPSLPYGWVSPLQALWLVAVGLIVAAIVRQERAVRAGIVRAAAIAERRRLARDLHDGLAQDLAFIASHGAWMAEELGAEHPLTIAASRALAVSRGAISDLSEERSAAPRDALQAIAHELGDRFQMSIAVQADAAADLGCNGREHVLRIAREAIANAGRHGRAKNVLVSLSRTSEGLALRVRDDGCGIRGATASAAPEGFGITSMRERAVALGGALSLRERDSGGTELEVVVP